MKTQEAYQLYLVQAQQNADYQNTILWILFTMLVIAPILLVIIYIPIVFFTRPKCPNCGSRRRSSVVNITKGGGIITTEGFIYCRRCKQQF